MSATIIELGWSKATAKPASPAAINGKDPVFAKIERHKKAYAAWNAAVAVSAQMHDDHPCYEAADSVTSYAMDDFCDAAEVLLLDGAETLPGIIALAEYLAGQFDDNGETYLPVAIGPTEMPWIKAFLVSLARNARAMPEAPPAKRPRSRKNDGVQR